MIHEHPLTTLAEANRPPAPHAQPTLLDDEWWDSAESNARIHRARVQASSMEVRSYFSMVGQSAREDYHRTYADLYGMQPVREGWSSGYTDFGALAFALNHVVNETEGEVHTYRKMIVDTTTRRWFQVTKRTPVAEVDAVLDLISVALTGFVGAVAHVPPHRWVRVGNAWHCDRRAWVSQEVPEQVHYEEVTEDAEPVWQNPYALDGGFFILNDSEHRNLRRPGCEGITVLVDRSARFHIVYWVTRRFPHKKASRRGGFYLANAVGKMPLNVESLPLPTTADDAIDRAKAIMTGMEACHRLAMEDPDVPLLPWMAAPLVEADHSVPTVSGSHEWLTLVADQRLTGERYRPTGATVD